MSMPSPTRAHIHIGRTYVKLMEPVNFELSVPPIAMCVRFKTSSSETIYAPQVSSPFTLSREFVGLNEIAISWLVMVP